MSETVAEFAEAGELADVMVIATRPYGKWRSAWSGSINSLEIMKQEVINHFLCQSEGVAE